MVVDKEQLKEAAEYVRKYMADNPGIKDLAPMYEAYPVDDRKYLSQAIIGIEPWKHMGYIPASAFTDCKNITSIVLPIGATSIGDSAFWGCARLTSIEIPNSVTSISDFAFSNCSRLTNIIIPNSVTNIGSDAFYKCTSLTSIAIPDSVTSIGEYAFERCTSLTSVTIPDSIINIERCAFHECVRLNTISYKGTVEEWKQIDIAPRSFENVLTSVVRCTDGVTRTQT